MANIAVIILNYNTWEETIKEMTMVHSILNVSYEDMIIVDNCSKNNSYDKLKENIAKGVTLVKASRNGGYASGNNIGLRLALKKGYKYGWVLNNDIIIKDVKMIEKMLFVFENDTNIAVVNPDIYSMEGYLYNRDGKRPSFFDFTLGAVFYKKKGRNIKDYGGYGYVYRPQGCCMLLDLDKMEEVGFMDEYTFLYSEERILAERLLSKNYRCACCTETSIIHNHTTTIKTILQKNEIGKIARRSFAYYLKRYRKFNKFEIKICLLFHYIKCLMED